MGHGGFVYANKSDFLLEKERLQERYEDFYQRIQEKKRKDLIRQGMAEAHKKRVQQRKEKYNASRLKFVRKPKLEKQKERLAHEKWLKGLEKKHKDFRAKYIQDREALRKIKQKSMMIPLSQEVGLEGVN